MTRAAERHAKPIRGFTQVQPVEPRQLQNRPLRLRKLREAGADHPATFFGRQPPKIAAGRCLRGVERLAAVRGAMTQAGLAAQRPAIRILKKPDANGSSRRVVEVRFAVHLEEHFLRDVFRLGGIAEDVGCDTMNEAGVADEEGAHRLPFRRVQAGDQFRVRRSAHVHTLWCYHL
jgi:hypothetical protein